MSRLNAILLVLAACIASPALSADPPPRTTPPASGAPPAAAPAPAQPGFTPDDVDPATGLSRSSVVRPLLDPAAPRAPDAPGAPGSAVAPGTASPPGDFGPTRLDGKAPFAIQGKPHIALILPTASAQLGRPADAVRQGFAAASEAEGNSAPPMALIGVDGEGPALLEACKRAQAAGATLVVTGLTRDGATNVARSECAKAPVLTLNQPIDAGTDNPNVFSISLSLEQEARQAALLAVSEGWRSAVIISSQSSLSRRVVGAFEQEWTRAAGEVAGRITFSGGPDEAPMVKDRLAQLARGDMVFIALDPPESRLVRPYVSGMLPVYATSLSVDPRAETLVNVDLQGVRYVDMPWFVQPDHPAVMVYPQPRAPLPVDYERLYALGIDAFRIAAVLVQGDKSRLSLDGVTGRITLEGHQFARTLTPAEIDGGRVIPLKNP
jgi:outer membrane PBP1 activator LpoA protein